MARSVAAIRVKCTIVAFLLTATCISAQTLELENLDGVPFSDRLVFSRIGSLTDPPPNGVHERVTLRLKNNGTATLSVSALTISGPDRAKWTLEGAPALPASIGSGSFLDVTVRFIAQAQRRVHHATLTVESDDPTNPSAVVELSGYWQNVSEGNREPMLSQIIEVLGYQSAIERVGQSINQQGRIEAVGDEVISSYWRRADPSKPVSVHQLASYHTYPESHGIFWHYKGTMTATLIFRHHGQDSQSLLPRKINSSLPAQGTFSPSSTTAAGVFGFRVQANEWSDPTLNDRSSDNCNEGLNTCGHHVRFWPVKDRQGTIIPNTFILAMDFAGINYDYQDNVYLISNIAPENPIAGLEELRINAGGPALTTGGVSYLANVYANGGGSWTPRCDLGDIAGTTDDDLYRTEWSEAVSFNYAIPAIAGVYFVRLHFAEIAHGNCSGSSGGPGKRVFDVWLEGEQVLNDFDISAEVGPVTALIKDFQVGIADGILNLDFLASVDFPMVSAIEVLTTSNEQPVATFTRNPAAGQAPLTVVFDASASNDNGSIVSYSWDFGDGSVGAGINTSHTYSMAGTYTAKLTVTDDEGAWGTAVQSVSVAPSGPISTFTDVSWSTVRRQPLINAEGQSAVVGGKLYSFGGFDSEKACCTPTRRSYVYDPGTNTWTSIADLPYTNGGGATHHGVATDGASIFLAGGYIANAAGTAQTFGTTEAWRYDVSSNTYSSLPDLPDQRAAGRLEYLNGKLHYFGGTNIQRTQDVGDHYVLHLDNLAGGWTRAAPLPNPRHHMGSVVLGTTIYAVGGQHDHDENLVTQVSVHAYNAATDAWTAVANLPKARSHHAVVALDGRIISLGGETKHGTAISDVDAYDPSSDTWTALTPLPARRRSGVAGSIGGILYYSGGNNTAQTYKGVPQGSDVNLSPVAHFTATPTHGEPPLTINFDGSGSTDPDGTIVSYLWDFGDGSFGNGVNISHTYNELGSFVATLVVTDDKGATGTTATAVTVSESGQFHFIESEGRVVMEAENYSGEVKRGDHEWALQSKTGNVGSSVFASPNSGINLDTNYSGMSPELQYRVSFSTTGTYYVWARVWGDTPDDDSYHAGLNGQPIGSSDRISLKNGQRGIWFWVNATMDDNARATIDISTSGIQTINAWMREDGLFIDRLLLTTDSEFVPTGNGPPESSIDGISPNQPLVARFTATPDSGPAPLDVRFDASASSSGADARFIWDFGDGNTGSGIMTTHSYSMPGTFAAILTVSNESGRSDTARALIVVQGSDLSNPSVTGTAPSNEATEVSRDAYVAADVFLPNVGQGIDASTLTAATVKLFPSGSPGNVVPANLNTSGGGDAIVLQPKTLLAANTPYVFQVTSGLKDLSGASFLPMQMSFTTGPLPAGSDGSSIEFEKVILSNAVGKHTSVAIGPDGKLYATQHDGLIKRWTIASDGTLSDLQTLDALLEAEGGDRLLVGLTFDPSSRSDNLIAWVTHTTLGFSGMADWGGKITRMSGPNLETVQHFVINLPRSIRDHVTNGVAFGPDGALYVNQGGNTAMGAPDNAWGNRPERKLSAAVLRVDIAGLDSMGALPLDVRTDDGRYDPYAASAPVKIFASGLRNAYDLVWHTNGYLYVPTNGSAANGKAPASVQGTIRPDGQSYAGPAIPAADSVETQNDFLFRVPPPSGKNWSYRYYGHPNPARGEYVLNGGNPTSFDDVAQVRRYPVGVQPDEAWVGASYNFGRNISPNGVVEYRSNTFGGALRGKLLVVRYSGGDDIIVLAPDPSTGDIPPEGDQTGITGFTQFSDPIDVTEDAANGNLYVSEYGGKGRIILLRPVDSGGSNDLVFVESGGQVVMEAENFDARVSRGGKNWVEEARAGNVGASMRSEPVSMTNIDTDFTTNSPEMQYRVQFNTVGTYYVWARALALDGDTDSWHVGLDGQAYASADRMTIGSGFNKWKWINKTMDGHRSTLQIPSPATHVVNVWMREDGAYIDRLLLTIDPNFIPSGTGPATSLRTDIMDTAIAVDSDDGSSARGETGAGTIPDHYELQGNYPNPYNPTTTIRYAVTEDTHVRLEVFDLLGRRVAVLVDDTRHPGFHDVVFDAGKLPSGVYLYRLEAGSYTKVSRMTVLK